MSQDRKSTSLGPVKGLTSTPPFTRPEWLPWCPSSCWFGLQISGNKNDYGLCRTRDMCPWSAKTQTSPRLPNHTISSTLKNAVSHVQNPKHCQKTVLGESWLFFSPLHFVSCSCDQPFNHCAAVFQVPGIREGHVHAHNHHRQHLCPTAEIRVHLGHNQNQIPSHQIASSPSGK